MIKEYKEILKQKLEYAIQQNLESSKRIPVELPVALENYVLRHPVGAYLIIYKGSNYANKDLKNAVAQNRDMEFYVVVAARHRTDHTPEDYLDFAIDTLSGIEIEAIRTDRKIYCKEDEWLKEENGEWWYAATFVVPSEFFEQNLRAQ
jgi:hypothetical protein